MSLSTIRPFALAALLALGACASKPGPPAPSAPPPSNAPTPTRTAPAPAAPAPAPLVRLELREAPSENNKLLSGTVTEIERKPDFSILQSRITSGGATSSAMFALRGACAVLRARGERYGKSDAVAGEPGLYRLSFPKAPTAQELTGKTKSVFSRDDCALFKF